MGMSKMLDITGVDLIKLVQEAYALSQPQGLGILHYEEGDLSEEEAKEIVGRGDGRIALSMDYVKGRACKLTVFREGGSMLVSPSWFDHTDAQFTELLDRVGVTK